MPKTPRADVRPGAFQTRAFTPRVRRGATMIPAMISAVLLA